MTDVAAPVNKVADFASAAEAALRDLHERVGLDGWFVARRDGDDYVVLAAVDDVFGVKPGEVLPWEDTFCARMADGSAPMVAPVVDDVPAYVAAREASGLDARSYLSVPIASPAGDLLGTLCAAGQEPRSDDLVDLLPTVRLQASLLGTLLSHELRIADDMRRAKRAADAAQLDPVTRTPDRRAWDAALADEEARAKRYVSSAAIVVVDLDGLRSVNDFAGHAAGDELLQRTADVLRGNVRSSDLLAHLGAGTFGVLLPLTDDSGAAVLVRHLRNALAEAEIDASIGFARRHADQGLTQAWHDADAAMRADKVIRSASRVESLTHPPTVVPSTPPTDADRAPDESGDRRPSARAGAVPEPAPDPDRGTGSVDALLRLARDQLGMDVAFLGVFEGDNRRVRNAQSLIDLPVGAGFVEPSDQSSCRLIADRRVPEVNPDVAENPLLAALPIMSALDIHAFVGVPIHRRNGDLYGTLCAFSQQPDHSLRDRDAEVLRSLGEIAMDLVEVEDRLEGSRHDLIKRLDGVYATGGPRTVYQPVMTLDGLVPVGFEALSRFPGSERSPADWFTEAAAAGLGAELELRAFTNALAGLAKIDGYLSINVSPATVLTPGFARNLATLPLHRLVIELTEHEQIHDYASLTATLHPLRARGLRIAVDDAGAGFASMAHILALVPDFIKLDISLVRGIDTDLARQALAAALTAFAAKTGAKVIAEGVETATELECLRGLGIDYGQGYHLGRPGDLPLRQPAPDQQSAHQ